ncbi:hypothetical protein [Klebsiella pneumoniae]|uniref:hypothetical protein n=1 Tax=Klebsiella pneumoniae TaxID=573 RepID=UPI0037BEAE9C
MTTNITALAQSLKAAAEGVIKNYDCEWFETGRQICTVHKSKINLISLANPANVLALVEALASEKRICTTWRKTAEANNEKLEKAQGMEAYWKTQCRGITDHCEELQARIAELESRTVKLPKLKMLEDYLAEVAIEERKQILVGVKLEFHRALTDAGIKVEAE